MKKDNAMKIENRKNGLDLLRIIAACSVVLLHINAQWLFNGDIKGNVALIVENLINLVTRFCVPCFLMISGMFLISNDKNEDASSFYKKSMLKIGIPYFIIAFLWIFLKFLQCVVMNKNCLLFVKTIVSGMYGNLWFMPMIIGLYVMTPLLVTIRKTIGSKKLKGIAIFYLLWVVLSQPFSSYTLSYSVGVVFAYLSFFMLGYALKDVYIKRKPQIMVGGGITCILALLVSMVLRLNGFTMYMKDSYLSFFSPTVVIFSIYVFLIFKDLNVRNIQIISDRTYYVYLLHTPIFLAISAVLFPINRAGEILNIMLLTGASIVVSFVASFAYDMLYKQLLKRINSNEPKSISNCR